MKKISQKALIRDLCRNMRKELTGLVDRGLVPEDWDGHELRELVYDTAQRNRTFGSGAYAHHSTKGRRFKSYRNHILCTSGFP